MVCSHTDESGNVQYLSVPVWILPKEKAEETLRSQRKLRALIQLLPCCYYAGLRGTDYGLNSARSYLRVEERSFGIISPMIPEEEQAFTTLHGTPGGPVGTKALSKKECSTC